jgi:hypothetical protein
LFNPKAGLNTPYIKPVPGKISKEKKGINETSFHDEEIVFSAYFFR